MRSNEQTCALRRVKFGGWYDGDNHKPGRGWYYVCACGAIGLGQLLPASAHRSWQRHADSVRWAGEAAA